ncbi:MAG: glycoside hydrolase family 127 protein [Anaerolineae bacterium]|nr:glycoside hydrolase family 127 protein [Anaerolineae bacterium]
MKHDYSIIPVPFTSVQLKDNFWQPRLEINRAITIPYDFQKCEETGRIENFDKAAGVMAGEHIGIRFNDSDVFKVIEGAAYSLSLHPDAELESYIDSIIAKINAAQEEDGYLFTTRTINPHQVAPGSGESRWSLLIQSHELYNVGHLYEAAAAYFMATGKRNLLNIAIKNADLIDNVFGSDKNHGVPGHEEIELGLVKLFRVTGEQRYLDLARFFIDERGYAHGRELYGAYAQDHAPVRDQSQAVGHAVRAGYLYAGMADVAALTQDEQLIRANDRIWEDVVSRKLHITGGIGARHAGEAFGDAYELPNATAYNETCAAIANILWNHRLFLLHGASCYIDVLERTLYNGFLAGVSFNGMEFFYPNPLASDGRYTFNQGSATRQPWFDCSCCPTNVVRLLPSLPGYIYAQREDALYVNLFISGSAAVQVGGVGVNIMQASDLPWDGGVSLTLAPKQPVDMTVKIRIPGWARGEPVPSDLYFYRDTEPKPIIWTINGLESVPDIENGYASFSRVWHTGDRINVSFPLKIHQVHSHPLLETNAGLIALERGPLVYCVEGVDHQGSVFDLTIPAEAKLEAHHRPDLLHGVTVLTGEVQSNGDAARLTAIPYYAWSHRGIGEMTVWLKTATDGPS